ncbi:MAG TPA: hypothetical protein VE258_05625 [Ktedonobacterales bacterium]|nr:hypothetical protein [Ktedonobacterales bacterium]
MPVRCLKPLAHGLFSLVPCTWRQRTTRDALANRAVHETADDEKQQSGDQDFE